MDALLSVVDPAPIQKFAKDSYYLVRRCTKPNRKGRVFISGGKLQSVWTAVTNGNHITQSSIRSLWPLSLGFLSWVSSDFLLNLCIFQSTTSSCQASKGSRLAKYCVRTIIKEELFFLISIIIEIHTYFKLWDTL
jgi:hypothetical protein